MYLPFSLRSFKRAATRSLDKAVQTEPENRNVGGKSNGYLEAYVSSTTSSNRYVYYNFSNPMLKRLLVSWQSGLVKQFPHRYRYRKNFRIPPSDVISVNAGTPIPDKADVKYIDELH
jgi:hypothetical protein